MAKTTDSMGSLYRQGQQAKMGNAVVDTKCQVCVTGTTMLWLETQQLCGIERDFREGQAGQEQHCWNLRCEELGKNKKEGINCMDSYSPSKQENQCPKPGGK